MDKQKTKKIHRNMRHRRGRAKIFGTKNNPRIAVFKSNRNMIVQIIDDESGKTLLSGTTKISGKKTVKANKTAAALTTGEMIGKKAAEMGIKRAIFDKGGFKYHGRVKAVADGLRKSGIKM